MSLTDGGILSLMKDKMSYLGQKSAVLAQNVANANTPGYRAKELVPFTSFAEEMQKASNTMSVTDATHIVPAAMVGSNAATKKMRSFEVVPSGNSVDLEQQMMEVSQTAVEYQADTTIYQKFMTLFRIAIGNK
ncbi:MAG: flagellar basal body rod protein FlgB [Alphaproteobacteria bacterium]|nr:flagellar basal body rod protein FlgB [Alphaproteobacteria bacterium]